MAASSRTSLVLCLAPLAAACAPEVALEAPPQVRSAGWSRAIPAAPEAAADLGALLGSAELAGLIARAKAANVDLAIAGTRVGQARALLRAARGTMLPVVTAAGGVSGARTERTADPFDFSDAFGGLDVAFELDLFGAGRAERSAASERLRAAEYDRSAVALAVEAEVARSYVQRAALAARIALVDRNLAQAVELERVIAARLRAGAATRVDLGLQTIQVRRLEAERVRLLQALDRTRTALAVLLGEEAPSFVLEPAPLEALAARAPATLQPAELIARRPDVRAAEARIGAAGGDVDQARAAFLPRIRLSAGGLGEAASLSGPLGTTFQVGADLLAPIFNRGRLRGQLDFAAARQAEAVELYRQALLTALAESEDALSAVERSRSREALLRSVVEEARLTARLARLQYLEGAADLERLLDAEQFLVAAEDALAVARQEQVEAMIDLFRAMGGSPAV